MPFILVDDAENEFVELPPGVPLDQLSKLIVAALHEQCAAIPAMVQKALDEQLYIEQPGGLKVGRFTGRIIDPETR